MNSRPLNTAYELGDMIVEDAMIRHGRWPTGMMVFVFDDAYGWAASISHACSGADDAYRNCILDLIAHLMTKFDLKAPRLSGRGFLIAGGLLGVQLAAAHQVLPPRHDGQNTSAFQKLRGMSSTLRKNKLLCENRNTGA